MFKLLYLKLDKHPQLGTTEIPLVDEIEIDNKKKPYTSVIIGANGTGKSYLLRTIADIFTQFNTYINSEEKKRVNIPFDFHIKYKYYHNTYEIITKTIYQVSRKGVRRDYLYLKNRPMSMTLGDNELSFETPTGYEILLQEIEFPKNLIVSSVMLNDRFKFSNSEKIDFYQYLGIRRTRSITSTQTFAKKTIRYLFDAKFSETFIKDFSEMLTFMEFEKSFKVYYNTKYNSLFFSGDLTSENFHFFFKQWWKSGHTRRKESSRLWGLWYYEKIERENPKHFEVIINYLNKITRDNRVIHKPKSRSKRFILDLFNESIDYKEYQIIEELVKLDILNLEGIKIRKKNKEFSIEQTSSGEYHLLISLLGLYSRIQNSSLILIDEPEISLHPNWQMRYINFLKKMFRRYSDTHFIITTHSHFLVSDLEGENSSVISLNRNIETNKLSVEILEGKDTYGWSAEEILYRVFKVRTTRNYYLELELRELLHKIAIKNNDTKRMNEILVNIKQLTLDENDPILIIIKKAEEYLTKI